MDLDIQPLQTEQDVQWLTALWQAEWGGDMMVSRGHVYRLADLQAIIAKADGQPVGAATYRFDEENGCELMSLNAVQSGSGVGTGLLREVERFAKQKRCTRVWLITSNDNLAAMRFYLRRGYRFVAVHQGAIDEARRLKPTIPLVGDDGIEIHDEIELAKDVR
ncbi:MAG: GNAT family N-acetyltransferase [Alicyclobacillus herbarius]|uniref:GNAT family N-acetyltransferase n=1 Tax=Alicyclobacillus herbarius TaxID=122960 RepID=UPI000411F7A4|nr:GNAT family N-acetyltransferase [Alicyclobacillus herbarius]MCL6631897.1 GNAT family N-acetyltransferase [Alicyclobacillus herbarius]